MDLRFLKGNSVNHYLDEMKEGTFYYIEDEKRFLINDMEIQDTNAVKEELNEKIDTKHEKLVSGQNIKTIGRESVLGSGNIVITPQTAFTADNRVLSVAEHDGFYWQGKKIVKDIMYYG